MRLFFGYDFPNWNSFCDAERTSLYKANNIKQKEKQFVCLDNFEIILSALDEKQYNELIDTLHDLTEKSGLRLLVSSRLPVSLGEQVEIKLLDGEVDVMVLPWDELMELNQTKLFVKVFGRDPTEAEHDSFRTLLSELGGNPRSIIITAQYGRNTDSINDLLAVWRDIGTTIPGEEKLGQNSLQFVIVQTWKIIKENSAAVYLWALHSYSKQPLDSDTLNELNHAQEQPFSFVDWLDGSRLLLKHGLTEKTNDGKEYIMHLALKEMFPSLGQEAEESLAITVRFRSFPSASILRNAAWRMKIMRIYLIC